MWVATIAIIAIIGRAFPISSPNIPSISLNKLYILLLYYK